MLIRLSYEMNEDLVGISVFCFKKKFYFIFLDLLAWIFVIRTSYIYKFQLYIPDFHKFVRYGRSVNIFINAKCLVTTKCLPTEKRLVSLNVV